MDNIFIDYWFWLTVIASFGLYYAFPKRHAQLTTISLTSLFVYWYVAGPALYILLLALAFTATSSHWLGHRATKRRRVMVAGVTGNLLLLVFFKYKHLLLPPSIFPLGLRDNPTWDAAYNLLLPIGISFYVFHGISLIVDSYRDPRIIKDTPATFFEHLLKTSHFLSFFPQVVAGPIAKGKHFYLQIHRKNWRDIRWESAITAMVCGYFLKEVIANNLNQVTAPLANARDWVGLSSREQCWMMLSYSAQIYTDFAGYSLIAMGLARLYGYELPRNFNLPYLSASFAEFWQRWHISLSSWLRDYLYIPLGGNRSGVGRTCLNIIIVMGLGGLWHGAEWRFACWGLMHGALLIAERGLKTLGIRHACVASAMEWPLVRFVRILLVFSCVTVAWLFFRMESATDVLTYMQSIITYHGGENSMSKATIRIAKILCGLTLLIHLGGYYRAKYPDRLKITRLKPFFLGAMLALCFIAKGREASFIYFQF